MDRESTTVAPTIVGIGAGGHARVMIHTARRCGWNVSLLVDRPTSAGEKNVEDVPVQFASDSDFLRRHQQENATEPIAVFIGVNGHGGARSDAYRRVIASGHKSPNLIDPLAIVESKVQFGEGVHVLAGATVSIGVKLGNDVLINHGSVIEHGVTVGDHVHVATRAALCGDVTIESNCLIGAGAIVLPGTRVAANSIVGAGAVVTRDVPSGTVVAGNPAAYLRNV